MSGERKAALHRLKRRLGKERARVERFWRAASAGEESRVLAAEVNAYSLAMGFIDDELRKEVAAHVG